MRSLDYKERRQNILSLLHGNETDTDLLLTNKIEEMSDISLLRCSIWQWKHMLNNKYSFGYVAKEEAIREFEKEFFYFKNAKRYYNCFVCRKYNQRINDEECCTNCCLIGVNHDIVRAKDLAFVIGSCENFIGPYAMFSLYSDVFTNQSINNVIFHYLLRKRLLLIKQINSKIVFDNIGFLKRRIKIYTWAMVQMLEYALKIRLEKQ